MRIPSHFHFAAPLVLADARTTWVQILSVGEWKHPSYGDMAITAATLKELKQNFDTGARDFVYADYDHGIAKADGSGNAIASGQVLALELRNGDTELWAEYAPTDPAREKIAAGEYRYTSADFLSNYRDKKTGKPRGAVLRGFALTNVPFIEGMQPLQLGDASGNARLFADYTQESSMNVKEKLGLPADASDEQIGVAIDSLKGEAAKVTTLSESVATATGTIGEVRSVLNLAETADVVGSVRTLAEQLASMKKKEREQEADKLVNGAVTEGRIAPAMKATYREQLLSENAGVVEATKKILAESPKVIPIADRKASAELPPEEDREKLLDERTAKIQKDNPKMSYKNARIRALDELAPPAAAGGEK